MSTGPTAAPAAPDFTVFLAATAQFQTDVTAQSTLYANYESAEAALTAANADANAAIALATSNLAAANDAQQAGVAQLAIDQTAIDAAITALRTPPVDPNAAPAS
jgi:hypothetical protein